MIQAPVFPPLLNGHRLADDINPASRARSMASKAKLAAGDLLWSEDRNNLRFAVVLEPEVPLSRCGEMLYLLMVAFGDAAGAICPPEIAITYQWPNEILFNSASVGRANLIVSDDETDSIPNWLILGIEIAIKPDISVMDPGKEAHKTTMWDEGCGEINRTQLLESVSRHMVNWIHTWSEDGFRPIHEQWMGRINDKEKLVAWLPENIFSGMDESGNALIKTSEGVRILDTLSVLNKNSGASHP